MEIIVNGDKKEAAAGATVADYVTGLGLDLKTAVIEYDGEILQKNDYDSRKLKEGCALEIIRFIGGG